MNRHNCLICGGTGHGPGEHKDAPDKKNCAYCGLTFELSSFGCFTNRFGAIKAKTNKCQSCRSKGVKVTIRERMLKGSPPAKVILLKPCAGCRCALPREDFYLVKTRRQTTRLSSKCKKCVREDHKLIVAKIALRPITLENVFVKCLSQARVRAAKSNLSFDISVPYLMDIYHQQNQRCYYTGRQLNPAGKRWDAISIDRIDSSRGYEVGNIVLTSWRVNCIKSSQSNSEFLQACGDIWSYDSTGLSGGVEFLDSLQSGQR